MPDANALRQARHDACVRLCACPRCGAPAGEACRAPDYVDPDYRREAQRIAGMRSGKTWASTKLVTYQMMRAAGRRQYIGGLHYERWEAMKDLDAVTRLGEIYDEAEQASPDVEPSDPQHGRMHLVRSAARR